jgi:hypothetical protein
MQTVQKYSWKKMLVRPLLIVAILLAGVLLTASQWIVLGIERGLPGIAVQLDSALINPVNGRVELTGLVFTKQDEEVLQLSSLVVDLSMRSLFKKQLVLDQFKTGQGRVWIEEQKSAGWRVAGVDLPLANEPITEEPAITAAGPDTASAAAIDALGVGFRQILLDRLTLNIKEGGRQSSLLLTQLKVTSPGVLKSSSQLVLALDSGLGAATVRSEGRIEPFADPVRFQGYIDLVDIPLVLLKSYVAATPPSLQGFLSSDIDLDLIYSHKAVSDFKVNGGVTLSGFAVEQDGLTVNLPLTTWKGEVALSMPVTLQPAGTIKGELTSQQGSVGLENIKAGLDKVLLSGVEFKLSEQVGVDRIELANLNIETAGEKRPLLAVEEIGLEQLQYALAGRMDLNSVAVTGSRVYMHRRADGGWSWSKIADSSKSSSKSVATTPVAEAEGGKTETATETKAEAEVVESLSYKIGALSFSKGVLLTLMDEGVSPVVSVDGRIDSLELGTLDSKTPKEATPFKITGGMGRYGKFKFSGESRPLLAALDILLKGSVSGISLPQFSPYVTPEFGYLIGNGSLDLETDTKIADNGIIGKNIVMLKMLKLVSAKTDKSAEIAKKLPVPMESVLDLLRDGNGDIEMTIPVSGSLDSPNIDFSGPIGKVAGKVSVKAAKTTAFAALGLVGLALAAVEMVGTVAIEGEEQSHLKPVVFKPGSSRLSSVGKKKLRKLAAYLRKKQERRITACGVVVKADKVQLIKSSRRGAASSSGTNKRDRKFYTVRVASSKKLALAEKARKTWKKRGYESLIREITGRKGQKWHLVSIGLFAKKSKAQEMDGLIRKSHKVSTIITKTWGEGTKEVSELSQDSVGKKTIPKKIVPQKIIIGPKTLARLAKRRSAAVKKYLVKYGKISHDRIFSCTPTQPKAGDKEGSRVEFAF